MREFAAKKAGGVLQRFTRFLDLRRVAQQRKENPGVCVILAHLDVGEGDHADARILELEPDDIGQLALDLLGDAAAAGVVLRHDDVPSSRFKVQRLGARLRTRNFEPRTANRERARLQRARDFDDFVNLELIAVLDFVVIPE